MGSLLTTKPQHWRREQLTTAGLKAVALWGGAARVAEVAPLVGGEVVADLAEVRSQHQTLVVVGGGMRIDRAKFWRAEQRPEMTLVAIPSLWGSGAEASPVVVLDRNGSKTIEIGPHYLPDIRVTLPELATSLSPEQARDGCGDAIAHALECLLSPLAGDPLRVEAAALVAQMQRLPIGHHDAWFEVSAQASAAQAQAGVGLVHGIAHTLEAPLRQHDPAAHWGHARLCALLLFPVMQFNRHHSKTFTATLSRYRLDPDALLAWLQALYREEAYRQLLPFLEAHWGAILRDPCSRINSAVVRPGQRDFFLQEGWSA